MILQAVPQRDLLFTNVFCSFLGSVHDAQVFSKSEIRAWCGNRQYFPEHYHLIGDAACPLLVNLMVPYKDTGHLGRRQINYNKKLSQTRVRVERAFGLLKDRSRHLKHFDAKVKNIPLYVLACCILHNICIKENDLLNDNQDNTDDDVNDDILKHKDHSSSLKIKLI